MMRFAIPAVVFVALVALLAVGLKLDPRHVPSPLIGKPLPTFSLPALNEPDRSISELSFFGKPRLLNVWASWCSACVVEHPLLVELSNNNAIEIVGLNYKDEDRKARAWLKKHNNPYHLIIVDEDGRLGLDLGVYGVPETFVIDKAGVIRHKQIGPLDRETIESVIIPMMAELAAES